MKPRKPASGQDGSRAESDGKKARVFLIDDHPIVRRGLAQILNLEHDLTVVGDGDGARGSIPAVKAAAPDLIILDISLQEGDGIDLAKEMQAHLPDVPILMYSMHEEQLYAERCLRAGARGYVRKQDPPATLTAAIRCVLRGEVYLSEKMSALLLQRLSGHKKGTNLSPMERLTDRELEVFRMIGAGDSVHDIADKLCLSNKTVEAHREHIKEKLGIKTSAELLRFAVLNTKETTAS